MNAMGENEFMWKRLPFSQRGSLMRLTGCASHAMNIQTAPVITLSVHLLTCLPIGGNRHHQLEKLLDLGELNDFVSLTCDADFVFVQALHDLVERCCGSFCLDLVPHHLPVLCILGGELCEYDFTAPPV